jgi:ATP-dependent Lhr-like helicase
MGFALLHPSIQHHIVNSLGWRELRPLQEDAVDPIVNGANCLLIAPTAGGKTEAALFPILSRMLGEHWQGLTVLYICPIRALLNNLESRISQYGSLVGRSCGLWHGDVGQAQRTAILRDPPDILLTTPESLEAMLLSRRSDLRFLFGSLQSVIIDEVHAFANDDRGWHLLALLERITKLCGRPLQRIGLSATIGNPSEILQWMAPEDSLSVVIAPDASPLRDADVQLDYVGSVENAALVISQLHRGEKRLVFCDSRSQAERLASFLRSLNVATFVNHSSLSTSERRQAERAFREARDCVIVATSTLELGIDVGDLDRVLQLDSPMTASSFLQRLGRTGRRTDSRRNCLFLATNRQSLLRAAALLRLWRDGYVEELQPPPTPYPVIAQQIMAIIRQEGGASRKFDDSSIRRAIGDAADSSEQLIEHMLKTRILFEDDGILGLGQECERLYGRKNFMALMSVFETPPLVSVVCGIEEIGWVHPLSFVRFGQVPVVISLGGRSWEVVRFDRDRAIAHVVSIEAPGRSHWLGESQALSFKLCRAVRSLLSDLEIDDLWSQRAIREISTARDEITVARPTCTVVATEEGNGRATWWTFGGLKANATIAAMLMAKDGRTHKFDNFFVEICERLQSTVPKDLIAEIAMHNTASGLDLPDSPTKVKFWECLPQSLKAEFTASRFTDERGASTVLSETRCFVTSAVAQAFVS